MDILFIGGVFNEDDVRKKSRGNIQNAANALQWNIIKGLDINNREPIHLLNSIFVGTYPKSYDDLFIKSYSWSHTEGAIDKNVGFVNISGIKHISRAITLAREIKDWANDKKDQKIIIAYSVHTPFLYAINKAKQINPSIKACLIVPDLPQYMRLYERTNKVYRLLKSIDIKLVNILRRRVNSYVILTKHMAESLGIEKENFIVIEGMININEQKVKAEYDEKDPIKRIFYSGTLNKRYGISTLLNAFKLIKNKNYRLQICGSGEAEKEIVELAKTDSRIEFLGLLNRNEVLKLQCQATVLINPRNAEGEFTKYSFPSKNMEYLVSARPTIAYKLSGMPDDYDKYMFYIEENTAESMAQKIIEVCEKSSEELLIFGRNARQYVMDEKNYIKQTKKMIEMLNNM